MDTVEASTGTNSTKDDFYEVFQKDGLRMLFRRKKSTHTGDIESSRKCRKRPASSLGQHSECSPEKRVRGATSTFADPSCSTASRSRRSLTSAVLPSSKPWVSSLGLTDRERHGLEVGDWLEDEHISAALTLLRRQFPDVDGLQPPSLGLVLSFQAFSGERTGLQILHNGGSHWVALSSMEGHVTCYDNLHIGVTPTVEAQITCLCPGASSILLPDVHRQRGASDCGLFAIANCLELALGMDPMDIIFDQPKMRSHLVACFEEEHLTPFPRKATRSPMKRKASRVVTLGVL